MLVTAAAQLLRISAREAPLIMLERLILESTRHFLRESRIWRTTFSGPVIAGSATYAFTLPTGALAHDIISAKLVTSNRVLDYIRDAGRAYLTPEQSTVKTGSYFITIESNDKFTLIPQPTLAETINLNVIMTLTRVATEIDDDIFEEYEEVLRDGALYRLFEMPMESWSNLKLATLHRQKFMAGIALAKQRGEESGTPGVRVMAFNW